MFTLQMQAAEVYLLASSEHITFPLQSTLARLGGSHVEEFLKVLYFYSL
jgi:hypothetical protein